VVLRINVAGGYSCVRAEAKVRSVETVALFVLAALAFSILGGVIEASWKRRSRRRLEEKTSVVLHPLARTESAVFAIHPPREHFTISDYSSDSWS
jgi:hypothetical protein